MGGHLQRDLINGPDPTGLIKAYLPRPLRDPSYPCARTSSELSGRGWEEREVQPRDVVVPRVRERVKLQSLRWSKLSTHRSTSAGVRTRKRDEGSLGGNCRCTVYFSWDPSELRTLRGLVRLSAGCWMGVLPRAFLTRTLVMALEENGGDRHRWEEAAVLDACN